MTTHFGSEISDKQYQVAQPQVLDTLTNVRMDWELVAKGRSLLLSRRFDQSDLVRYCHQVECSHRRATVPSMPILVRRDRRICNKARLIT